MNSRELLIQVFQVNAPSPAPETKFQDHMPEIAAVFEKKGRKLDIQQQAETLPKIGAPRLNRRQLCHSDYRAPFAGISGAGASV